MEIVKEIKKYQNQIFVVLGAIALLSVSIYGYTYYKRAKEENAYRAFVSALEYFQAPVVSKDDKKDDDFGFLDSKTFSSDKEKWERVDSEFKKAYDSNSGAGIAPMFLAYRSEALIQLGRSDEAIKVLKLATSQIKNKPVLHYYQSKLALLLIDSKSDELAKQGLGILKKIATDDQSVANDVALYHLGEHFWHDKKFDEAKNYWNQLVLKYDKKEQEPSPFVEQARIKLELIDFDAK